MEWPIFFKDALSIANLDSSIGICTLWSQQEKVLKDVKKENYAVCGNLYSLQGINPMIKNILANPKIRYIIVCGRDLSNSKSALINFFEKGVDNENKIIGCDCYIDSNVEKEKIDLLRKNVKVLDVSGGEKLNEEMEKLENLPPFSEPILLEEGELKMVPLPTEDVSYILRADTISEAWLKLSDLIMKFGEIKKTEYGDDQKEILDLMMILSGKEETLTPWLGFNQNDLEKYYPTIVTGEKPCEISYTYGERLFSYPLKLKDGKVEETYDQIADIIKHLKEQPHTRRANVSLWNVSLDSKTDHPPCITQIVWSIKNNRLHQTTVIRSNDMFNAWPLNAFGLKRLQDIIANKVGVKRGSQIIMSISAHIYKKDWKRCQALLDKEFSKSLVSGDKMPGIVPDKRGYFLIKLDNGEIVVEHILPGGKKSGFVYRGKRADAIYKNIIHDNLLHDTYHAAYVGRELGVAQKALEEEKEYKQDSLDPKIIK